MITKEERSRLLNELTARIDKWKPWDLLSYAYDRYYDELDELTDDELKAEYDSAIMCGECEDLPWEV
jgi:hypothetical protein